MSFDGQDSKTLPLKHAFRAYANSDILQWLPNQLQAVMQAMVDVYEGSGKKLGKDCDEVMEHLYVQRETLRKEVEKYCQERGVEVKSA